MSWLVTLRPLSRRERMESSDPSRDPFDLEMEFCQDYLNFKLSTYRTDMWDSMEDFLLLGGIPASQILVVQKM